MNALFKCGKLFCHSNPIHQINIRSVLSKGDQNGIFANLRRTYHQYKPKDRPSLHETTPSLDPSVVKDVLLYRYEEPMLVCTSLSFVDLECSTHEFEIGLV